MSLLRSLLLAFSCFSRIPVPQVEWHEDNMRYLMCCFPAIGAVIGVALGAWCWLAYVVGFGSVLFGAGITLIPVILTGGIHLDGFCDVVDAQSSHASPERKRAILKDPHIGAFAAIGVAGYLIAYFALACELAPGWQIALALGILHISSRCLSGIATVAFPASTTHGMLSSFRKSAESKRTGIALIIEFALCAIALGVVQPALLALPAIGLVCLALVRPFSQRQFGGMSGDIAGFFLQCAELAMLVALVVVSKVVGL